MPNLFRLMLVTDRHQTCGRPLLAVVEQAVAGGVDAVQLREKDLPARQLYDLAHALRDLCRRHGAALLINDRIDIALAVGADGVHLPVKSFAAADARKLLGSGAIIGVSTHSLDEAKRTERAGADYIIFGPVFETPSKQPFGPPVGLDALQQVADGVRVPVVAIGGITPERARSVIAHGARGLAVIAAILTASDPRAAAGALSETLAG